MEISNAEFEVLSCLWRIHPAPAADIIAELNKEKQWHEKTVKTLLGRMVKKGAIKFEKDGRSYVYIPLLKVESYVANESKSLLERLFSGKIAPFVAGFTKNEQLSAQDIDDLKAIIKDWEKQND